MLIYTVNTYSYINHIFYSFFVFFIAEVTREKDEIHKATGSTRYSDG